MKKIILLTILFCKVGSLLSMNAIIENEDLKKLEIERDKLLNESAKFLQDAVKKLKKNDDEAIEMFIQSCQQYYQKIKELDERIAKLKKLK